MSSDPQADLADALRQLLTTVHRIRLDDHTAEALTGAVVELSDGLGGADRRRWYDPDAPGDAAAKRDDWRRWSLFRGDHQALAPPMRTERGTDDEGPFVRGRVTCGPMYEGPPGSVHGGYLAGLFDDLLGACLGLVDGPSGVTGRLTVRYRRPTPLDHPLELTARPVDVRARRLVARAQCLVDGRVTAEAEALFVRRELTRTVD
ncbi:MAG: PaaI family thioesterase [Acidimicrobiia bacterium]|nr:PaaI family thioesterase [Acidimicrobiia bacterium]